MLNSSATAACLRNRHNSSSFAITGSPDGPENSLQLAMSCLCFLNNMQNLRYTQVTPLELIPSLSTKTHASLVRYTVGIRLISYDITPDQFITIPNPMKLLPMPHKINRWKFSNKTKLTHSNLESSQFLCEWLSLLNVLRMSHIFRSQLAGVLRRHALGNWPIFTGDSWCFRMSNKGTKPEKKDRSTKTYTPEV